MIAHCSCKTQHKITREVHTLLPHYFVFVDWCQGSILSLSLIHWGRVTHICVSKLTIIGSDNGLSPDRRQAIIWINARVLLIGPLGTNFNEILIKILTFSFKKMRLKVSSAKRCPSCLGLNVLKWSRISDMHTCHLKSSSSRLFAYQLVQANTKALIADP